MRSSRLGIGGICNLVVFLNAVKDLFFWTFYNLIYVIEN